MTGAEATAPGKILLAGEYAVLEGAPAVVVAVTRRARAWLEAAPPRDPGPFLAAARAAVAAHAGPHSAAARAAARVAADSTALARGDTKLGLGSSAAVTVAAIACALAAGGLAADAAIVHPLAHRAHADAQARAGARGSGTDVAAATWGGVIEATPQADRGAPPAVRALPWPGDLRIVPVFSGRAASTPALVARVTAARAAPGYPAAIDAIAAAAAALARALARGDADAAVGAFAAGHAAIDALARATAADLVTGPHRRVAALAAAAGGAAKPTGAGGGDLVVAAFSGSAGEADFRRRLRAEGLRSVDLDIDSEGVTARADAAPPGAR